MDVSSFTRDLDNRLLGGVCAGLASRFGIDAFLVRAAFVVLAPAGGVTVLLYLVLWLALPPAGHADADRMEAAREGADEMAAVARVASDHVVAASRTASGAAVKAARSATTAAASAASAARDRRRGQEPAPEAELPEDQRNSPAGPIP